MKTLTASLVGLSLLLSSTPVLAAQHASKMMDRGQGMMERGMMKPMMKLPKNVCSQTAMDTRDSVAADGQATLNTAMKAALSTRIAATKAAWALTDTTARTTALKAAWQAYHDAVKAAHDAHKVSQKTAEQAFHDAMKTCKDTVSAQ